jgi:hypothetical protein
VRSWRVWAVRITLVAALVTVDLALHWPLWLLPTVAALGLLAIACLARSGRRQPGSPTAQAVTNLVVAQPPELRAEQVADVLMPSQDADYRFLFSATVLWCPAGTGTARQPASLAASAVEAIVRRASEITRQRAAASASLLRWELASALGEMKTDSAGCVHAMAESVQLVLPASDQERLDKLAAVRKDETVWEHERRYEQSKRRYLSGDVLKDPGSAVVWWLSRNNDEIEKAVRDIGLLVQLYSAANNTDTPAAFRHLVPDRGIDDTVGTHDLGRGTRDPRESWATPATTSAWPPAADHFDDFLAAMNFPAGDPQRILFAQQVAMAANANGRPDIAEEIVRRSDPPCADEDGAAPGSNDARAATEDQETTEPMSDDHGPADS